MPAAYSAVQENMSHISALEQSFVTSLHLARKLVPRYAALLDPSHIYDLEAQKVFRSLKSGKPLTTVPFSALALRAEELPAALEEIQRAAYLRLMLMWGMQVQRKAQEGDSDGIVELMSDPPRLSKSLDMLDPAQLMAEVMLNSLTAGGNAHRFQSPDLAALGLSLMPNSIHIVAGQSGGGKSALTEQMLLDLSAQGAFCLDITVELARDYRAKRYLQHLGGPTLSPDSFAAGTFDPLAMNRAVQEFTMPGTLSGVRIQRQLHVSDTVNTIQEIGDLIVTYMGMYELYVQARSSAGMPHPGPPVVMIDYLQLITVPKAEGIYDKMNAIVEPLYHLTKKYGMVSIWLSQLRKGVGVDPKTGEYVPDMSHLEGSGRIQQVAHNILFVYPPPAAWEKGGWKKSICSGLKVRGGPTFRLEGLFSGQQLSYTFDPDAIRAKL